MPKPSSIDILARLRGSILDQIPDGVIALDHSGRIAYWNRAAEILFDIRAQDAVGTSLRDVGFSPWLTAEAEQAVRLALANKKLWRGETVRVGATGHAIYLESSVTALTLADGDGSLIVVRDITKTKRRELEQEKCMARLRSTLTGIRAQGGLIPICSTCKRIRDDDGVWHDIEAYIDERLHTKFSHGICPTCVQGLHPDFFRGSATP
jgi:PAS domain S-box-containing protein